MALLGKERRLPMRSVAFGLVLCLHATRTPCCLLPSTHAAAIVEPTREYQIKGVLLFHFLQFVTWPEVAAPGPGEPYVIGVLGRDPFGSALDAVVRQEKIGGHPIIVEPAEIGNCHVLFIDGSLQSEWSQLAATVSRRGILTVADFDGFAQRGGMIQFYQNSEGKTRLRVNLARARECGLQISARLLRVAEVISRPEG
jgi:hypothetical protein